MHIEGARNRPDNGETGPSSVATSLDMEARYHQSHSYMPKPPLPPS
jgi:hypothetical protein